MQKHEQTNIRWGGGQFTNKLNKNLPKTLLNKNKNVKLFYLLSILFIVFIIGVSLALPSFLVTLQGQVLNRINACKLNINFKEGEGITLLDTFPMTYSDAQKYEPLTFTITKKGDCLGANYNISMISSCKICEQTDGICTIDGNTCDCNNQIDSTLISYELTNLTTGEIYEGTDPYALNLAETFSAEEEKVDYEIKLWINEEATNEDIYISTETTPYTTKDFCAKLNIDVYNAAPEYCFTYTTDETNKTATITDYLCYEGNEYGYETITDVAIPETFSGYTVTTIGEEAFRDNGLESVILPNSLVEILPLSFMNNNLTNIEIPDSVITIGQAAFYINSLNSVIIGDSVEIIGNSAFNTNQIENLILGSSIKTIGPWSFVNNNLTEVILPESVTIIDKQAFRNNKIRNVVIPESVTSIGSSAFQFNNLSSVIIPDSVETIGDNAFQGQKITTLKLGNNVKTIDDFAFNTNLLTELIIPNSVETIGESAFAANNLTKLYIPNSVTTIGKNAFSLNDLNYVVIGENSNLTENTGLELGIFYSHSSSYTSINDITYKQNPNLSTIYNNSGKSFDFVGAITATAGTPFIEGTVPSYDSNIVTITTGYPE